MNKTELYKLPKDILVELIIKIQKQTEDRILSDKKLLTLTLIDEHDAPIYINTCEECDGFEIHGEDNFHICEHCGNIICDDCKIICPKCKCYTCSKCIKNCYL